MKHITLFLCFLAFVIFISCSSSTTSPGTNPLVDTTTVAGVIGNNGITAWDKLATTERNKLMTWNTLFIHQSVGQDLEDGCEFNGFPMDYFARGGTIDKGLYGGLFRASNGSPLEKFSEFKEYALANKSNLKVVCFKFGYADIEESTISIVQEGYKALVDELKANGLRVLHVTPPLVYDVAYNSPKMSVRTWMLETFKNDIIFDLQEIESKGLSSGVRCEEGSVGRVCDDIRSTAGCPSRGQGIDTPAQGHLCEIAARTLSKSFLYSLYLAGK
ncbi:MAG: hypothetical protein IPM69_12800 [Ignavibacteria bacterium]|nr:hypothetical protein [Ignavibacteria bacterium]